MTFESTKLLQHDVPIIRDGEAPKDVAKPNLSPSSEPEKTAASSVEIGGRDGPEPTRFGDWEKGGRCIDF